MQITDSGYSLIQPRAMQFQRFLKALHVLKVGLWLMLSCTDIISQLAAVSRRKPEPLPLWFQAAIGRLVPIPSLLAIWSNELDKHSTGGMGACSLLPDAWGAELQSRGQGRAPQFWPPVPGLEVPTHQSWCLLHKDKKCLFALILFLKWFRTSSHWATMPVVSKLSTAIPHCIIKSGCNTSSIS